MKRISVEDVLAAYKATGLKPARNVYLEHRGGRWCGCALSALMCNGHVLPGDFKNAKGDRLSIMARTLGLSVGYAEGFICGFDNETADGMTGERRGGYEDGRNCSAAVFAESPAGEPR